MTRTKMHAGLLDRRVQFLRAPMVDDGLQTRPGPFAPHGDPVWAARAFVRDSERFAADSIGADVTVRFTVRYSSFTAGIDLRDRVRCEGREYGIFGIKELGRRVFFEITASELRP